MAATRVPDHTLERAIRQLAEAQKEGDATRVRRHRRAVAARSRELERDQERSAKTQIDLVNGLAFVVGLALLLFILFKYTSPWNSGKETRRALGWAALIVFSGYAGLGILRWRDGGLLSFIRAKDGRLSTSLLQVGLWTFAVSSALVYFIFFAFYSPDHEATFKAALRATGDDSLPEEYLLLLGGPFAAAVIARMTTGAKVNDKELQKVPGNAKLLDVIADDDAQANLVDAQFLIFNLVALTWFAVELISKPTVIPTIPWLLVGLTSTSAIAYSAAKSVAGNRPVVTSVTRYLEEAPAGTGAIRPGDFVEIEGVNFVPAGAATAEQLARIVVKFGDRDVSPHFILDGDEVRSPSDNWIVARVPQATEPGDIRVSVITAAGIESDSRDFTVVQDEPLIDDVSPPTAKAGNRIYVVGRYFRAPGADASALPSVRFGKTIRQADALAGDELEVTVPPHLPPGALELSVRAAGGTTWSDPVPLNVRRRSRFRRRPRRHR